MKTKNILLSKTFWFGVLTAVLPHVAQPVKDFVTNNPVDVMTALGAAAVLIRFITSGKITIFPQDADQ